MKYAFRYKIASVQIWSLEHDLKVERKKRQAYLPNGVQNELKRMAHPKSLHAIKDRSKEIYTCITEALYHTPETNLTL